MRHNVNGSLEFLPLGVNCIRAKFLQTFRFSSLVGYSPVCVPVDLTTEARSLSKNGLVRSLSAKWAKDLFGHPFHLLNVSPLPLLLSLAFFFGAIHLVCVLKVGSMFPFFHALALFILMGVILI